MVPIGNQKRVSRKLIHIQHNRCINRLKYAQGMNVLDFCQPSTDHTTSRVYNNKKVKFFVYA